MHWARTLLCHECVSDYARTAVFLVFRDFPGVWWFWEKKKQQNKKDEAHVSIPVPPEVWVSFDWNGNIWLFFFFLLFS